MTPKPKKTQENSRQLQTINWSAIERQVRLISRAGDDGVRLRASPEEVLAEAHRLAEIYRQAGKSLPDTLAALV